MNIIGIDLSSPSNLDDTAACILQVEKRIPRGVKLGEKLSDIDILELGQGAGRGSTFALDAPLSYNPGGGMRDRDSALVEKLSEVPGSAGVISPTTTSMAYLTMRGMTAARLIEIAGISPKNIVEVNPSAALLLHRAPYKHVANITAKGKAGQRGRETVLQFLSAQLGISIPAEFAKSDHAIIATAAAWAAWKWKEGDAEWIHKAEPPHHPYDFIG